MSAKGNTTSRLKSLNTDRPGHIKMYIVHISITVRDSLIKLGHWRDVIDWFNHDIFVCMIQAKTWISILICPGLFVFKDLRREVVFPFVG
jgi:hypothetical protein